MILGRTFSAVSIRYEPKGNGVENFQPTNTLFTMSVLHILPRPSSSSSSHASSIIVVFVNSFRKPVRPQDSSGIAVAFVFHSQAVKTRKRGFDREICLLPRPAEQAHCCSRTQYLSFHILNDISDVFSPRTYRMTGLFKGQFLHKHQTSAVWMRYGCKSVTRETDDDTPTITTTNQRHLGLGL